MISEIKELSLDEINAVIREINSMHSKISSAANQMVLPTAPKNPSNRQMWWESGEIKVFTDNGIETYSKD